MTAYHLKQYFNALELLQKEYNDAKTNAIKAEKAFYLGNSYAMLLENEDAQVWYLRAEESGYGSEATLKAAYTYKKLENYQAAISKFRQLESNVALKDEVGRQILICEDIVRRLSAGKNTAWRISVYGGSGDYSDYSPALFDEDYIVFTSDREGSTGSGTYGWTGNNYSDIYIMRKGDSKAFKFDAALNSDDNEGTAVFSKDYKEIYFTRCSSKGTDTDATCRIMASYRRGGVWSEPVVLPLTADGINAGQPCLIENDSVLVFSRMSDGNVTGYDLWYSERLENGQWSEAFPMPRSINTDGNEYFPTSSGDTLFFSSDFLPGYGGLDIFKTGLSPSGSWSKPENMGYPLNTGGDDYGLIMERSGRKKAGVSKSGFFSSSRLEDGFDRLFYFEELTSKDTLQEEDAKVTQEIKDQPIVYLAIKVSGKKYSQDDDPTTATGGKISLKMAKVRLMNQGGRDTVMYTDRNGIIIIQVPFNETFEVNASSPDYFTAAVITSTKPEQLGIGKDVYTVNVELLLDRIFKGKQITLENIFYDFNEFYIREDAKPTLNDLALLLKINPALKIELGSHTDCRGEESYNLELSQKRADAAVEYLMQSGIDSNRLRAIGYGESQLEDNCACEKCSESQHQKNRRTTFKVL